MGKLLNDFYAKYRKNIMLTKFSRKNHFQSIMLTTDFLEK